MKLFSFSITIYLFFYTISLIVFSHIKYRQEGKDAYERHEQSADGAFCQWEPEGFTTGTYQEYDESLYGRYHCEEDGDDLGVPCLGLSPHSCEMRIASADFVVP